jgi:phage gp29-like protein
MPSLRALYDALPWRHKPNGNGHGTADNAAILTANQPDRRDLAAPIPMQPRVIQPDTSGKEYGASGTQFFGGFLRQTDFNPDLDNFQTAVRIYEKMRRTDAQIRSMLQVLKLPLRGATWMALPPENGDNVDQAIADFINDCLFADEAMEESWDTVLRHILLQLEFGFSIAEIVWTVDEEGAYRIKRLAPRLPKTIRQWNVDRNGHLIAVVQYAPIPVTTAAPNTASGLVGGSTRNTMSLLTRSESAVAPYTFQTSTQNQMLTIPADYLVLFSLEKEGDNYEGSSLLRPIFRNYFFKDEAYRLEGVRLDRWGVGIPVASLAQDHSLTADDLDELVEILKKVRSNERAFLIAPPGVSYDLMPKAASQTAGSGAMEWINHHDAQIVRSVLAGFLTMGQDPHGTHGFGSRLTDMFVSSLNGIARGICADLKRQLITKLCAYNFDMTNRKLPHIVVRDLEQVDLENMIQALSAFSKDGFIQPDDDTEKLLRKMLQMPDLQPEMSREKKAKAQPGTAAAATVAEQVTSGQATGTPTKATPPQGEPVQSITGDLFAHLEEAAP